MEIYNYIKTLDSLAKVVSRPILLNQRDLENKFINDVTLYYTVWTTKTGRLVTPLLKIAQ